jgi:hypothetical protein
MQASDLEGIDTLLVLAQLAIGVAGFTGIVTAVHAQRGAADLVRAAGLIANASGLLALSLAPAVFQSLGMEAAAIWRAASTLGVLIAVAAMFGMRRLRLSRKPVDLPYQVVFPLGGSVVTLAHLLNVALASFGLFLLTLVATVLLGLLQFAHILLVRPPESD